MARSSQPGFFSSMGALFQTTVSFYSTDTSQLLTAAIEAKTGDIDFSTVRAILLSVEDEDIRIAFGVAASITDPEVGHVVAAGGSMRIPSYSMIKEARIISKETSSPALVQVTMET